MTKLEYLEALSKALAAFPEEIREATLNFYGEMLEDRMEDGLNEEAAVAAMEAPEEIASRLMEEEPTSEQQSAAPEGEKREAFGYVEKRFSCSAADVSVLRILAGECPVHFVPAPDEKITLIYHTSPEDPYQVSCEKGVILLEEEKRKAGRKHRFSISWNNVLHFMWGNEHSPGIRALIPAQSLLELDFSTRNASIHGEGVEELSAVTLSTQNASIVLQGIRCKSLQSSTTNAALRLSGISVKRDFKAETSNARIEAEDITVGGRAQLITANGKLKLTGVSAGSEMALETTNGNIALEMLSASALRIRTSNGKIQGTLPGKQSDWQIESKTSNGRNSLPTCQAGEKPLTVHTSNGNIALAFEEA